MKKYWTIVMLAIISIIGLGVYYIDNAKALNVERVFRFETLEGDDKYLDNKIFEANFYENHMYENYIVTKNEATRLKNIDFYYEHNLPLLEIFEEHKSFFRAKHFSGRHFYNDDKYLAYVYSDDQYHYDNPTKVLYKVDRLNKETDKREKVDFLADAAEPFRWQTVEWVHHSEDTLQALVIRTVNHGMESVILVSFNFEDETVTEQELIEPIKNHHISFQHSNGSYNNLPGTVISQYNNDLSEGIPVEKLFYYNIKNGIIEIDNPDKDDFASISYSMTEKYLVSAKYEQNEMLIKLYNLQTAQWEKEFVVDLVLNGDDLTPKVQYVNDEIYVLYEVEKGFGVEIVDSTNGEKLYAGLLTVEDTDAEHYLTIYNVYHTK